VPSKRFVGPTHGGDGTIARADFNPSGLEALAAQDGAEYGIRQAREQLSFATSAATG
jgi:hypothetical protein